MKHVRSTLKELRSKIAKQRENRRMDHAAKESLKKGDKLGILAQIGAYTVEPDYFYTSRYMKYHARADWSGAPYELKEFAYRLYRMLKKMGVPMYFHTVYRSPALQEQLKSKGYSNLANGPHQRSAAFDMVHSDAHWDMSKNAWQFIGILGKEIAKTNGLKVNWGGDFRNPYDPAHWELQDWRGRETIPYHTTKEIVAPLGLLKPGTSHYV